MRTSLVLLAALSLFSGPMARASAPPKPAGTAASLAYPAPQGAGFHNCVLIYDRSTRGPGDLAHYVARTDTKRPEWLFDAFLFLIQGSQRGIRTEYGETQKVDWQYQMDRWFAPGRDLAALDAAIANSARHLGPPPAKRRVILSIPYPNRAVTDFGDVDGDGKSEDLSTPEGRRAVLAWYVDTARERFRAAGYRHLALWGFYWMREDMEEGDEAAIRQASDVLHERDLRLLWIPYYRSPGFDRWRASGIDVAILQPNYAFSTWEHGGSVGRNRLAATADLARANGMGVEIEAWDLVNSATARRVFRHYLADGAIHGYQKGANGFFLSTDILDAVASSPRPEVRAMYDALADYVAGRPVKDPDARLSWAWSAGKGGARVATARMPKPGPVSAVEVMLREPGDAWRGLVEVAVRRPKETAFSPGGWAMRTAPDRITGAWQMVRIPVEREAEAVRVTFRPSAGSPALRPAGIAVDPIGPNRTRHAALFRPYRITPAPQGQYPDSDNELTDGRIPEDGFLSGRTVGWMGGREVAVSFDLGRVVPVEAIEAHCQGGSVAAVNWPAQAMALLAKDAQPEAGFAGFGTPPAGIASLRGGPVVVDRQRGPTDQDGHIAFTPKAPISARFVTLLLEPSSWLMLSEVRILSGGRNVAPEAAYTLRPLPSGGGSASYADDGLRLTDGIVAQGYVPAEITGWQGEEPREVTVDLGAARPVQRITLWSLRGGQHGIFAPKDVSAQISADGASWSALVPEAGLPAAEDGTICEAAPLRFSAPEKPSARYVRVRASCAQGWAMLSEVAVE